MRSLMGALAAMALFPSVAAAEFCRSYTQTASSGGDCPTCALEVSGRGAGSYAVASNNGWTARFTRPPGQSTGTGEGEWPAMGERFAFTMREVGNDEAAITMKGSALQVEASFRCTRR